jgi:Retroviral aspartyl protease
VSVETHLNKNIFKCLNTEVSFEAILDSGCTHTMISHKAFEPLPEDLEILGGQEVNLIGAGGQSIGTAQRLKLQFGFRNEYGECLLDCYVCDSLKKDIFLGFSWFETLNP